MRYAGARMVVNVALFCGFIIIVIVMGAFLWQTLFGSGNPIGGSIAPTHINPAEEAIAEYTRWLAFFTAALVFATLALFISGERNVEVASRSADAARDSALAAKKAVELSDRTAQQQLRAYFSFELANVILNSPGDGKVTAWMRFKNVGVTPAYKVTAWQKFSKRPTADVPFDERAESENEAIIGPTGTFNSSTTLDLTPEQLTAVIDGTLSLFVWGRLEYEDAFKHPRHYDFKTRMSGPVETIIVDGVRAQGWGLRPIQNGIDAN